MRRNSDNFYKSLIVLANPKTVVNDRYAQKEVKDKVIRAGSAYFYNEKRVAESREIPLSKKEMLEIAQDFLNKNREERKDYFAKYENLVREMKDLETGKETQELQEQKKTVNTIKEESEQKSVEELQKEDNKKICFAKNNKNVDTTEKVKETDSGTGLICPRCGSELVVRTAKKGANVGNMFYGCSNFPRCRFVRNIGQPEKN